MHTFFFCPPQKLLNALSLSYIKSGATIGLNENKNKIIIKLLLLEIFTFLLQLVLLEHLGL